MKNIKEYLEIEDTEIRLYHKNGYIALWYSERKNGYWYETTYDTNVLPLTGKDSNGSWIKYTRSEDGKELTYEGSDGKRRGFDIEEMTMEEVCKALGKTIKITK